MIPVARFQFGRQSHGTENEVHRRYCVGRRSQEVVDGKGGNLSGPIQTDREGQGHVGRSGKRGSS